MSRKRPDPITPLIYVGSKAGLLDEIATAMPISDSHKRRWLVPFCGGLSPVLKFRPDRAVISDLNPELIHFWEQVRDDPTDVLGCATEAIGINVPGVDANALEGNYYDARDRLNELITTNTFGPERAGLFLVVNRFGFRGLWRVNAKKGHCNIPFYHPRAKGGTLPSLSLLRRVSNYLTKPGVELRCETWEETLAEAESDSFIYVDPPYDGVNYVYASTTSNAATYGITDQLALAAALCRNAECGVPFMAHNNPTVLIKNLYRRSFIRWVVLHKDHRISYGKKLDPSAKEVILTSEGVTRRRGR